MNSNKIFARYELKYLLSKEQFERIISLIENHMQRDKYFDVSIRNIFYDTSNYYLIRNSLEKPEYKEKIRLRSYKTVKPDDDVFVEIKKKYKQRVYKRREIMSYEKARLFFDKKIAPNDLQITKEIAYSLNYYQDLKPVIFLAYNRLAYTSMDDTKLRITFDRNIIWRDYDLDLTKEIYGNLLIPTDVVLMEVKTNLGLPRWLLDFLGENKIYKQSFSKVGNVYLKIKKQELEKEEDKIYA